MHAGLKIRPILRDSKVIYLSMSEEEFFLHMFVKKQKSENNLLGEGAREV
jgi:hypothetical protein